MKPATGKTNNWYTPALYIDAVQEVFGTIDLDVASCAFANEIVKATRYYTEEENALLLPWTKKVFCNPPYGRTATKESLLRLFVGRLLQQYRAGICTEAILLIPVNTATKWFVPLLGNFRSVSQSDGSASITRQAPQMECRFLPVLSTLGRMKNALSRCFASSGQLHEGSRVQKIVSN